VRATLFLFYSKLYSFAKCISRQRRELLA